VWAGVGLLSLATWAAAVGLIVGGAMFVGGVIAHVVEENAQEALLLGAAQNAGAKKTGEHFRKQGDYVEFHSRLL
jgi:hypothetical protein